MHTVEVLGPVRVEGRSITSPTQLVLLTILAAAAPKAVTFERLIDGIWDDPPPSAENSLHSHLTRLRKALGDGSIVREGRSYRLASPTDVERFQTLLDNPWTTPDDRRAILVRALGLWRGDPFGIHADHRFVRGAADSLVARHGAAQREVARLDLADGDADAALTTLRRLVAADPHDEEGWVLLVEALATAGHRTDALRAAQDARALLAEVGLNPSTPLRDAEELALQDGPVVRGRPISETHGPLIGRDHDLGEILASADQPGWTSLVGPGGVGKTRLALEAVDHIVGPVSFVDLTETAEDEIEVSIARAVGAPLRPPYLDRATSVLSPGPAWLVLDCCELVSEQLAVVGRRLIDRCPQLRILATSRTPIGLAGERLIDVQPLAESDAGALLRLRAEAAGVEGPDDDLADRLCRAVDCLPLNLEILAGALRTLSAGELLDAIADPLSVLGGPDGSLAASVDRSVSLLTPEERSTFVQLAQFRGPFVAEVARSCVEQEGGPSIIDHLRRLRDLSLLTPVDTIAGRRLRMLDTVRAVARTASRPRSDSRDPEHRYVAALGQRAAQIETGIRTPEEMRWLEIAETETGDLRAAHQLAIELGLVDVAMGIPASLFTLVYDRLRADLATWADESIDAFGADHPLGDAVLAVAALGAMHVDDHDRAWSRLEQVSASGRISARPALVAANLHLRSGQLEKTDRDGEHVVDAASRAGDFYLATIGHILCGLSACYLGDRSGAGNQVRLARRMSRKVGAPTVLAYADYLDGEVLSDDDPVVALQLLKRAHDRAAGCRSSLAEGVSLVTITTIQARSNEPGEAAAAFGKAIRHWRDRGDWNLQWSTLRNFVEVLARIGDNAEAAVLVGGIEAHGPSPYGAEARRFAGAIRLIDDNLGRTEALRHRAIGRSLTNDELLNHALATARSAERRA